MMIMKSGDRDVTDVDVREALEAARYQFAKTMPDNPHSYTMIKWWDPGIVPSFKEVARFIKVCGTPRKWGSMRQTYFDAGEFSYWAMDPNPKDTVLINRCKVGWVDPFPNARVKG